MTEPDTGSPGQSNRGSMAAVSHTAPRSPRNVFSEMFRRGQTVQADGGRDNATPSRKSRDSGESSPPSEEAEPEMREVDHETPEDDGVSRVWKRGGEDDDEE